MFLAPVIERKSASYISPKFNIVLFLSEQWRVVGDSAASDGCNGQKGEGSFLNFPMKGSLSACKIPKNVRYVLKENRPNQCDCEKLLKCGLLSLVQWARNDRQMATGISYTL